MTETEIIKAATHIFAQKGYNATTMQEIAEGAGIKKPTIYLYYGSKGELFLSIIDALARTMENAITNAMSELGSEPLEALLRGVFLCQADLLSKDQLLLLRRAMTMSLCYAENEIKPRLQKAVDGMDRYFDELKQSISGKEEFRDDSGQEKLDRLMDAYELFVKGYLRTVIFSDSLKKTDAAQMWHGFWYGNRL